MSKSPAEIAAALGLPPPAAGWKGNGNEQRKNAGAAQVDLARASHVKDHANKPGSRIHQHTETPNALATKGIGQEQSIKKDLRQHVQAILVAALPVIFAVASALGSYRSFSLCYGFFARFNSPDGAWTMAALLVAVAFATPQAVPLLWPEVVKGKRIVLFCLVVVLSGASVAANVMITAQELRNQRVDTVANGNADARSQIEARISELSSQAAEVRESQAIDKEERRILLEASKALEVGSIPYNRTRNNLEAVKGRIDAAIATLARIDAEVSELRQKLPGLSVGASGQEQTEVDAAINWASSIIIEIGGPVALSLALFL